VDRTDIALGVTEIRLGIQLPSWSVPTPPVQAFVAPTATVWDISDISDSSDESDGI
jgi:hypothetical protein